MRTTICESVITKPLFYVTDYMIEILSDTVTQKFVWIFASLAKNAMYLSQILS